jgi:hypothetical protein
MDSSSLRAGDADRERVAERLRIALEEGRLNLTEYDERLRDAFSARTYADLDALLTDLPPVTPASKSQLAVRSDGSYPAATARWLAAQWGSWARAVVICTGIWAVSCLLTRHLNYFWPGWVAGPWGVVLLVRTVQGLSGGEPQEWAARRARRAAARELRRQARHGE